VQRVGEKWIFSSSSRSFGYGYGAVRIRVKIFDISGINNDAQKHNISHSETIKHTCKPAVNQNPLDRPDVRRKKNKIEL
jgi:hypothetical protein